MGNNATSSTSHITAYSQKNDRAPIKKYTRLKNKLILSILMCVGITFILIFGILAGASYKAVKNSTLEYVRTLSEKYAGIATDTLERALETSHIIRSAIASLQTVEPHTRRKVLHDLVEKSLQGNSSCFSMWVCYEPNQFDGLDATYAGTPHHDETGRVIMYFEKDPATKTVAENMLTN